MFDTVKGIQQNWCKCLEFPFVSKGVYILDRKATDLTLWSHKMGLFLKREILYFLAVSQIFIRFILRSALP